MIQPEPQSERPGEDAPVLDWANPRRVVLENGLTVLIGVLPHLCTASMGLYIRVGSRYERAGDYGLSHLLEHLLFRGCEGAPTSRALNEAIEGLTPGLDASTGREFTALEALCAPDDLERLLGLVGKMVTAPRLDDVDTEREIILQEIADEVDQDGRDIDVDNVAKAALFPGDGLGQKIGGDPRSLMGLTREDCQRWLEAHYVAENMVLAVVLPDPEAPIEDWATAALGAVPRGAGGPDRPPVLLRDDLPALDYVQDGSRVQVAVQCAWVLPAEDADDWPALRLLHRLLDDGSTARLRRRIVDELALAYHAGCDLEVYDGVSVLTFDVETSAPKVLAVVDALEEIVSEVISGGVDDGEWARIRRRYIFEMGCLQDAPSALCSWMGLQELHPPYVSVQDRLNQVLEVDRHALSSVCAEHLAPERRQLTIIGDLDPLQRAALRRRVHRARVAAQPDV